MNIKIDTTSCTLENKKNEKSKKVFGTHEWADKTANFIDGCKHDCKYCYSKEMAIRFKRKTPETWRDEVVRESSLSKTVRKSDNEIIMFPSSHDIHPEHLGESILFLNNLVSVGNNVLIVTKPHYTCIKKICDEFLNFKQQILFRFTIGSSSSKVLKFWEPGATNFNERIRCLKYAYSLGYETSISCEPMLDDNIVDVVEKTRSYVTDKIWIGKANFLIRRLKMNGESDPAVFKKAEELLRYQSDENILLLYQSLRNDPKIKWKESIQSIIDKNK